MNLVNKNTINSNNQKEIDYSLDLIKNGSFNESLIKFNEILKSNYSNKTAESGVRCCKYWIPRIDKINNINNSLIKANKLLEEWIKFEDFSNNIKKINKQVKSCIMYYIFHLVLTLMKDKINTNKNLDYDEYFLIGLSYKNIGDFNQAIAYFKNALKTDNNSNAIAQLADCYALIDEEKKAKLLFREAFFINPSSIELNIIDSNIITQIVSKLIGMKIKKDELPFYLPVYARVMDVFIVMRELTGFEINRLNKDILLLEKKLKDVKENESNISKYILLNHYLWLYDFYNLVKKNNKYDLEELEYKIKTISEPIFNILKKIN